MPKRIAIFRALNLGDLLCAVPSFRALRRAYPDAHIALISLPWAQEFVDRFPAYLDEFILFPGWPGLPGQPLDPPRTVQFLQAMQARQWDVVLQQQDNGSLANTLLALVGAAAVGGFHPTDQPEWFAVRPDLFMPYPEGEHEIRRHVRLMSFLGIPDQGYDLEFPLTDADRTAARPLQTTHGLSPGSYVCMHPGGVSGRRWPAANFARVGNALAEYGLTIVLTGTPGEQPVVQEVRDQIRFPTVSVVGKTSLGTLSVLLRESAMLISNDTGVSHVAAANAVNSVIVFTSADPAQWPPLDAGRHRVVHETEPDAVERVILEATRFLPPTHAPRAER